MTGRVCRKADAVHVTPHVTSIKEHIHSAYTIFIHAALHDPVSIP